MNPGEFFHNGQLTEAIAAATQEVRTNPADRGRRWLLAELLCFAGDLERADKQLDVLTAPDAPDLVAVAGFRQLLRAELARREFFEQGRPPELLAAPPASVKLSLEASIHLREGRPPEAAELLRQAEEARSHRAGERTGAAFADFRDLDDLTAAVIEVLTANGTYYWVPVESIEELEIIPPQRPRDLLWVPARMQVRGGPDGAVFLPVLYPGSHAESDETLRLGRRTEWRGGDGSPVRGVGQREFLVGEEVHALPALGALHFAETA
jgi:type VI secretion system protein ImpE